VKETDIEMKTHVKLAMLKFILCELHLFSVTNTVFFSFCISILFSLINKIQYKVLWLSETVDNNKHYVQGIHKRMVQFQKLARNLFLTLHVHSVHRQQQQLSKFLTH
jgi:hypothetical protein